MSIYTQREHNGRYELTDVARAELIDSTYYNWDLAPTTLAQRTWTTYNVASLWVSMCICIPSYVLAASLVSLGLSPLLAVLNVAIGSFLVLIPIQLNSHVGTKYGVPYPVFARLSFGPKGAHIASLARALAGCCFIGIHAWYGGKSLHIILMSLIPNYDGNFATLLITFLLFLSANYRGSAWIRKLESWGAPFLLCLTVVLFLWAVFKTYENGISFIDLIKQPVYHEAAIEPMSKRQLISVFTAGLTSNLAFWSTLALNIPDFSRYARSQKTQFRGQLYGLPTTMIFFAFVGAYVTAATRHLTQDGTLIKDPADLVQLFSHPISIILACAGIIIATLTTNIAANTLAPANGFSNLLPKKISYKTGVIITGIVSLVLIPILRPWKLMNMEYVYIYDWLGTYGIALAPMAGIFIADYYFVKKRNVDVPISRRRWTILVSQRLQSLRLYDLADCVLTSHPWQVFSFFFHFLASYHHRKRIHFQFLCGTAAVSSSHDVPKNFTGTG